MKIVNKQNNKQVRSAFTIDRSCFNLVFRYYVAVNVTASQIKKRVSVFLNVIWTLMIANISY